MAMSFPVDLGDLFASMDDLDEVTRAVAREQTIRNVMTITGESREITAQTLDAVLSMDQEAVLDLMDGKPTTLYEGLQRYMGELEKRDELQPRDRVLRELESLLAYPWPVATAGPGRELEVAQDVHWLVVMIGGREVIRVDRQDGVLAAVSDTARAVHKAMTSGDK